MLIGGEIECPKCLKKVSYLEFWKQIGDKYFHLCSVCMKEPTGPEDLIMIGFHHGRESFKTQIKEWLI